MPTEAHNLDSTVFVIMPFGSGAESPIHRGRYETLIRPAVDEAARKTGKPLHCVRADEIDTAGKITDRVVQYLSQSRIVIADLHGLNPNVMYELGVRHAIRYGTILLALHPDSPGGKAIPFNVAPLDVVLYVDHMGLEQEPVRKLTARICACLEDSSGPAPDSPVQEGDMRRARELLTTNILDSLGKHLASALKADPGWAAEAMMQSGLGPGASTIFGRRLAHFRDEKRLLARRLVPFLLARCRQLLDGSQITHIYLLIDSGTTLVPIVEELAKYAKGIDERESWLSKLRVYTNNLAGVEALMEHRRARVGGKLAASPIECHLFPGEPLAEYSAIVGEDTNRAVKELCEDTRKRGDTALIGLLTGNWVRMRRRGEPCPVPLARGKWHLSFKQTLVESILSANGVQCRGEVLVVTPLGKVFFGHGWPDVQAALKSVAPLPAHVDEVDASDEEDYKELHISEEQAKSVGIVATSRVEGRVLSTLSGLLKAHLHRQQLLTKEQFVNAPLGRPKDLLFEFDELNPIWARQVEQEFPHERTRTDEFLSMFSAHMKQAH